MRIRWRGLELPGRVSTDRSTMTDTYGKFSIEPFERGFGVTIGTSLRQVLLSTLEGSAVTEFKIPGLTEGITTIPGVVEDSTDIQLNIKSLVVKNTSDEPMVIRIDKTDFKGTILARDIIADPCIEIINPDHVIATLRDEIRFQCEMKVENGRGFRLLPSEEEKLRQQQQLEREEQQREILEQKRKKERHLEDYAEKCQRLCTMHSKDNGRHVTLKEAKGAVEKLFDGTKKNVLSDKEKTCVDNAITSLEVLENETVGNKLTNELILEVKQFYNERKESPKNTKENPKVVAGNPQWICIDSNFSPVTKVKYEIVDTRVGQKTNYDKLILHIWTNGSISPQHALVEASKIFRKHLNPFMQYSDSGPEVAMDDRPDSIGGVNQDTELEQKLSMSLAELELSVRATNCLETEGITTVRDLVSRTEAELLEVRNFGETTLKEVKQKLNEHGMELGQRISGIVRR